MVVKPNFDRLRHTLLLQGEPDKVPLLEGSVEYEVMEAFLGHPVKGLKDEIDFWAQAGFDCIPLTMGFRQIMAPDLVTRGGEKYLKDARQIVKAHYGVYDKEPRERGWAKEGRGIITTQEQFNGYPWLDAEEFDYSALAEFPTYAPSCMKVIPVLGNIFTMAWELMGMQTFFTGMYDNPDLINAIIQRIAHIQDKALEICLAYDSVGAIWMSDDFGHKTDLLVNPEFLRRHIFPLYANWGRRCLARGLPYIFHSDGKLDRVMEDIIQCGFNALHPIEPQAMDIVEVKRKYGNYLCLIGNIDLDYTLTLGTPSEVRELTKTRIRQLAPGGGYCVGSSNSITEYVPLENFNAMREATFQYGKYPIQL